MTKKPTLLADVAELRNALRAMDAWEVAGGELDTDRGRRSFVDGLTPDAVDELAGLALTGLLRSVLTERDRLEEDTVTDVRPVRDEEHAMAAEQPASADHAERVQLVAAAPGRDRVVAYPPRQRSCRVIAAGWLRRRSEPLGSSPPAVPVGAAVGPVDAAAAPVGAAARPAIASGR